MATRSRASRQDQALSAVPAGQGELFSTEPYRTQPASTVEPRDARLWMSTAELASCLNVHPNTVRNYVNYGVWPAHRLAGKFRFSPQDVEAIEQLSRTTT